MRSFNERVYALVRRIPPGKVLSYGRVAALLGNPRGARAVGWALHQLPARSGVPWHRVVNASGRISTSCDTHTAAMQRALLEAEGVRFEEEDALKLSAFAALLWQPTAWELIEGDEHADPD